jgi:DNA polymerase-3 subunit epsilon
MRLRLERPLCVFDLETTGVDPLRDRIVEVSVLNLAPDGTREVRTRRVNPERPIPPEATAVHGIRDEDVASSPPFRLVARSLLEFFGDADLAGFNVRRFDVPLLDREFRDCGLDFSLARRRIVDAMTIFHMKERRDLAAAVKFYLGRGHEGAHGAEADVLASAEVLFAQLERYPDLPADVGALDAALVPPPPPGALDRAGKFVLREGKVVFAFGKHTGKPLAEVARSQPSYLEWILGTDFPDDARAFVEKALRGAPSEGNKP